LHAAGVKNGRVLIIGSITPWVEACVLEAGARQIVTVEYSKIESYHKSSLGIVAGAYLSP
jgi:hypothetical protein